MQWPIPRAAGAVSRSLGWRNTRQSSCPKLLSHQKPGSMLLAAEMTSAGVLLMYWGLAFGSACSRCARHLHARPAGEAGRTWVKGRRTRLLRMIRSRMPWTSAGAAP